MRGATYEVRARVGRTHHAAVTHNRRDAMSTCRRLVRQLGDGASGTVRMGRNRTPLYRCAAVVADGKLLLLSPVLP
jgi:hypothetical protein